MRKIQPENNLMQRISMLLIGVTTVFATTQASAGEFEPIFKTEVHMVSGGLSIHLPVVTQSDILNALNQAHVLLSQQKQDTKKIINESNRENNVVIAAIIPGGLLYLAYKRNKLANAKTSLTKINNELTTLNEDTVALYQPILKPANQPTLIAHLP